VRLWQYVETRSTATRSTRKPARCASVLHGKQRFMDTAGRIERFQKKYGTSYMKKAKEGQQ